mgnify:CR=1 FL=1
MRREWMAMILAGVVMTTGCVSNSKYQEALTEADTVREELDKARQQKSAMEQQIRTLKELNVKLNNDAQAARDGGADIVRIDQSRDIAPHARHGDFAPVFQVTQRAKHGIVLSHRGHDMVARPDYLVLSFPGTFSYFFESMGSMLLISTLLVSGDCFTPPLLTSTFFKTPNPFIPQS